MQPPPKPYEQPENRSINLSGPAKAATMSPGMELTGTKSSSFRRLSLQFLYIAAFGLIAWQLIDGWNYYQTPYLDRPHHEAYRLLRPAGSRGLLYGIIGSAMMILMLVYTLQKRTQIFGRTVSLRPFLDIHIFFGVIGPLFIVLHTSFKVQGLVAISFWSMVAVAASGYLGRYLYQQIPRTVSDNELSLSEINQEQQRLGNELKERTRLSDDVLLRIDTMFTRAFAVESKSIIGLIVGLIWADLKRPFTQRRLRIRLAKMAAVSKSAQKDLFKMARQRSLLNRRVALLERVHRLFHYWHVIHKPFAIIMYLIMIVHIAVAIWTGYGWFS
jgi:hypothetical protein